MKYAGYSVVTFALLLLAVQFIKPQFSAPTVTGGKSLFDDAKLDANVRHILQRSCADCHSNQFHLPWYGHIAPISWLIVRHINQGRKKLDFSDWPDDAEDEKQDIADSVDKDEMPIHSYLWMHRSARLTIADRKALEAWADGH